MSPSLLSQISARVTATIGSNLNLSRLARTRFFPVRPEDVGALGTICIGTKSGALGDALILTSLAGSLRRKYPGLRVRYYNRAFNPVVYFGNPHVQGADWLPDAVFGDDVNWGEGHNIQQKERFFGLPISGDPKPEIHLTRAEKDWAESLSVENGTPICILHPSGRTHSAILEPALWDEIVSRWKGRVRFWQIGLQGQRRIPGCDRYFLGPAGQRWCLRKDFAVMSRAQLFVGVDSGPMHVARAFSLRGLVMTSAGPIPGIFERRQDFPYFLYGNWKNSFLYEANRNIGIHQTPRPELWLEIDRFFEEGISHG